MCIKSGEMVKLQMTLESLEDGIMIPGRLIGTGLS